MEKKIIVSSLALDLRRIAQGLHRGSLASAARFKQEAWKRGGELEELVDQDEYLLYLWRKTKQAFQGEPDRVAEDILMYSILFQNVATKKL